jgi:hypothetical protein
MGSQYKCSMCAFKPAVQEPESLPNTLSYSLSYSLADKKPESQALENTKRNTESQALKNTKWTTIDSA